MSTEFIRVRDCTCPGTPHTEEGDGVLLAPTLSAEGGIVAEQDMSDSDGDVNVLTRRWLVTFVRYGARGWNIENESGPIPFDVEALLADWALARPVALRAGELYQASVMAPFQQAPPKPSRTGRTRATTSATSPPTSSPSV